MVGKAGERITDRQGIADLFAEFYENLYATRKAVYKGVPTWVESSSVPKFEPEEIKRAAKKMAKKKAGDDRRLVIEMIQNGGPKLFSMLADLFTDILEGEPPDYWKSTKIRVLFKKGDAQDPANYRPIAMLPILYKLFARVLCGRIGAILDASQPVEQAGFRTGFGCEDHIFTMSQLVHRHGEFRTPLWAAAIDFEKAFDSVEHESIWRALVSMGVPGNYVRLLGALYADQ
eukprot:8145814-Karenia_brevis.AAC.1